MDPLQDEDPGYFQSFLDIKEGFETYLNSATYSNGDKFFSSFNLRLLIEDFMSDWNKFVTISVYEVFLAVALGVFMTFLRFVSSKYIFIPLASYMKLNRVNSIKFPESMWKCLYYFVLCCYLLHVMILSGKNDFFYKPYSIWNDYYQQKSVPTDVGVAFLLEFSYYLHSLYGTLYMDSWRKDSAVMIFHHLLCLVLIGFSYVARYHKVGLLLMFLHDYADIFLEFSKCQVYMKYQNGKYLRRHDFFATASFCVFTVSWFVGRLYLFPVMVIRSSSYSTIFNGPSPTLPFYFIFNILLWFMFALNIYWFFLILKFLYKVVSGQIKDLDDIRDYDVDDKIKKDSAAKKRSINGCSRDNLEFKPQNDIRKSEPHGHVLKRTGKKI